MSRILFMLVPILLAWQLEGANLSTEASTDQDDWDTLFYDDNVHLSSENISSEIDQNTNFTKNEVNTKNSPEIPDFKQNVSRNDSLENISNEDISKKVVTTADMNDKQNKEGERRKDLERNSELELEVECLEDCERLARASDFEFQPGPYLPWYAYPQIFVPYFVPYMTPVPVPVTVVPQYGVEQYTETVPIRQIVPVKGKVTIAGTFNDCRWNYPVPSPFIPANYDTNLEMGIVSDQRVIEETVPFSGIVPVSSKVTIAAQFNDCGAV